MSGTKAKYYHELFKHIRPKLVCACGKIIWAYLKPSRQDAGGIKAKTSTFFFQRWILDHSKPLLHFSYWDDL